MEPARAGPKTCRQWTLALHPEELQAPSRVVVYNKVPPFDLPQHAQLAPGLQRLKRAAWEAHNTIVSYHVDTDNAYENITACSEAVANGD